MKGAWVMVTMQGISLEGSKKLEREELHGLC